uniref:Kinase D-interacting substrate of 220 kDa-like n=1 Tax=Saccoglossus kowalevskii TaxID=10224 RepID=A0ABM0MJT8_SACKO|nr:PREDICTED: kinase D-interacting substrate of 220 kDa-like [Saccoglossus kowalevskii]
MSLLEAMFTSLKHMALLVQTLFGYINDGDLSAVAHLLEKQASVDERDENGQTALLFAADRGQSSIVDELLRRGAEVDSQDEDQWTALLCASRQGYDQIVKKLLDAGADIEHQDMGEWTALMWACYKGRTATVKLLLEKDANPNIQVQHGVMPIIWAAGRGHWEIVELLLEYGAKVDSTDRHGTTSLVWAARKGHLRCVQILLDANANVDVTGMRSWTPLIAATKGGHFNCVQEIISKSPNCNALDVDGHTALSIAAKEGHTDIVCVLLDSGAYVNLQDRNSDSILISAVKGEHVEVVKLLIEKFVDVDVVGADRKTALHWAVEKGNVEIVEALLECAPNTETYSKSHETPLIKASRIRNTKIVRLLLDNGAKVSATDKKGDTALHIAIRGRHKAIAELLLRNPKDGRLLYRPNRAGETPYNLDCSNQKSILTQIFGAKSFTIHDNDQSMLSDLYSSSLADILSEPTMAPPITVGLFARWGSGKSFLLKKLQDEMKLFAEQDLMPVYSFSALSVILVFIIGITLGLILGFTVNYIVGLILGISVTVLLIIFLNINDLNYLFYHVDFLLVIVHFVSKMKRWVPLSIAMARHLGYLQLLLKVCFCNPPKLPPQTSQALPIRFLFTDYKRLTRVGGETSLARMIGTLCDVAEMQFGFLVTRLYRVFKTKADHTFHDGYFRRLCCIPIFLIVLVVVSCIIMGLVLLAANNGVPDNKVIQGILISLLVIICIATLTNIKTLSKIVYSLIQSQRKRVLKAAKNLDSLKQEGFMRILKQEVELMAEMVKCIDAFSKTQTRLVVIVDGLDSCEQEKVLQVLDTVHVLFSWHQSPFITVLAIDPHIIIKAIELNFDKVFRDADINGHDYLKNVVQLPFYMEGGFQKMHTYEYSEDYTDGDEPKRVVGNHIVDLPSAEISPHRKTSRQSSHQSLNHRLSPVSETARKLLKERTFSRQLSTMFDLTKLLSKSDQFGGLNPRSMRRLLNIVSITVLGFYHVENLSCFLGLVHRSSFKSSYNRV